jgi:PAS domain S-box-containing protein
MAVTGSLDWENIILGLKRTTIDFLETVVDNLNESIIVTDLEGKIVYFNKGSEKIFGYSPEEILGRPIVALGVKSPNVLREIRNGRTFRGELVHTRKGGERCPTYVICIPLKDEQGRPIAMVGSARDLTEEKEINRLRAFNEKVVTSLNDGIQIIDKNGQITFVNPRFEEIIGWERKEIIGRHYQSFVAKEGLDPFVKEMESWDPAKGKKVLETTYVTKANLRIPVLVSTSYLQNDNQYDGMINAVTDITEIKILKEELFQSEKMTLLGKLAGEIAHEINNPLSGLILATQMLKQDCQAGLPDCNELLRELQGIEEDARRCKTFIEKLLGFSRMIPEEKKVLNINDIIEEALLLVQRQAELDNVSIVKDFSVADLWVWGNSNNLQQVIINLVNNAREALSPSEGMVTLKTYALTLKGKPWASIEVHDSGKGISPAVMAKLFDSFFTTKDQGTGLGLAISKRIIEEHGGTITVSNRKEGGTSFVLTLPRKE